MTSLLSPRLSFLVVVAGVSLVPGCGKESVKLAPVTGMVTVGGQPVPSGHVSLIPFSKEGKAPGLMTGTIDSSGKYTILTDGKEGAPLGKYKVTVTPSTMPTPGAKKGPAVSFNRSYMDADKTTLTIEVVENPPPGKYDLPLTK